MTPHEYALARSWDFTAIEATARIGIADADEESLESAGISEEAMLAWCREQVSESTGQDASKE